jgi:predicted nuclease of predicted toxin-antitoxin system
MKFKIDENLPAEFAELLREAHYDALTVVEQKLEGQPDENIAEICSQEERILITLDIDFTDIRVYPPSKFPGFIVFRVYKQDKYHLISLLKELIPLFKKEPVSHQLWIVEEDKIRIRD